LDKKKIEQAVRMILEAIGEDVQRSGLQRTPERVAELCEEVLSGMQEDPSESIKVFTADNYDEIVLVKDIPLYSICEHHLLPFYGKAHVAYIPKNSMVTGISSLARVVETLAKRLQVQERLTVEIADVLVKTLDPLGVIVVLETEHLCMSMRGIKKPGAHVVTSAVRGVFRKNAKTRAEVMQLLER
jgi:GTP cyclohydrolase I